MIPTAFCATGRSTPVFATKRSISSSIAAPRFFFGF
jgi:hypothetical protein